MIDPESLCQRCLKDFTGRLPQDRKRHESQCRLPYTNVVLRRNGLSIYCLEPNSQMNERRFAFSSVAATMSHSGEIKADGIGWQNSYSKADRVKFEPHAFVPVQDGKVAGIIVVMKDAVCPVTILRNGEYKIGERASQKRFCINRVWVAPNYRGRGIASALISSIELKLSIKAAELGWVLPLTETGEKLRRAICKNKFFAAC